MRLKLPDHGARAGSDLLLEILGRRLNDEAHHEGYFLNIDPSVSL